MPMSEEEKRIRRKLRDDFAHYASKCLSIRSKSGEIKKFALNEAQRYLHSKIEQQKLEKGYIRAICLKGRQQGISTYIEGRFYWRVTHTPGVRAFILTHSSDATQNLFEMAQRYHQNCPAIVRPTVDASNAKELSFSGLDSGYRIGTAGNQAVGRSSTIQLFHGSECAFWEHASEHAKGILQTIPMIAGTEVFLESTANGIGNYFHEQWQLAEANQTDFISIFIPWYWQDEYKRVPDYSFLLSEEEADLQHQYKLSLEQLCWRRYKIAELSVGGMDGGKSFQQEYPMTAAEAFIHSGEDNFIKPDAVSAARKCNAEPHGPLIIGVDPARFGDDRTGIIRRRNRCAYNLQYFSKKDTMEVVGIVHNIIMMERPDKVCVDIGGLGAGVYDRLRELGHDAILIAVNGGATPLSQDRYINKRAEMWGLMNEWLHEVPCQIPDDDALHADLIGVKYRFDSNSRLVLEKKEDMKKRGLRSPDGADSLALTFAIPERAIVSRKKKDDAEIAKNVMSRFNQIDRLKKSAYR